jgi:hypothetical protein
MPSPTSLFLLLASPLLAQQYGHEKLLASLGFPAQPAQLRFLIANSPEAEAAGIHPTTTKLRIQHIRDQSNPSLPIIWEKAAETAASTLSPAWHIQAVERWTQNPVLAWRRDGETILLWTATPLGPEGYERYPFLPQALLAAGLVPPATGRNLWAFFDAGYRQRADVDYLATRWRQSGLSAIHVTSWQFDQATPEKAAWLESLIRACHRHLIHVYAWVELPHVSNEFWDQYPQCREKTAAGTDAQLDWRRLINLVNPDCSALAETRLLALLRRFDWDGVNLGELYFESLEGHANPSRFTPFNADVQREFAALHGAPPKLSPNEVQPFLDYRANLAARLQHHWLARLATLRQEKPSLDILLTHIDDRFDPNMRAALGADAARLLKETEPQPSDPHDLLFLIEDPATTWHLGPRRYAQIRQQYEPLTPNHQRLAIDINIVERYQDVYPTKQQTGAELAQLIHQASQSFDQVALYFEFSLRPEDLPLLGPASSGLLKQEGDLVELRHPSWLRFAQPAQVNGTPWPFHDGASVLLPAGRHRLQAAATAPPFRILDCNATLLSYNGTLSYKSRATAWFLSDTPIEAEMEDGTKKAAQKMDGPDTAQTWLLSLPSGTHAAKLTAIPEKRLPSPPPSVERN